MQQSENQSSGIEIALWQYSKTEGDWNRWMQSLSSDERERAATYRFERDRASFIAGRYLLRQLLSAHTRTSPSKVPLSPDKHGKLRLEGDDRLQFSLANTDGLVAVAVAPGCDHLGIDCERADTEIEAAAVDSYCSADERRWLAELPAREHARAAIALWTLKESHLKALGVGLREDPATSPFPGRMASLSWSMAAMAIAAGITVWSKAAASTSSRWLLALNPGSPAFRHAYFRTIACRPNNRLGADEVLRKRSPSPRRVAHCRVPHRNAAGREAN